MTSVLVLNGPNLNLLGTRKPEVYGTTTLVDVEKLCRDEAGRLGLDLEFKQSNYEGQLIDWIHETGPEVGSAASNTLCPPWTEITRHRHREICVPRPEHLPEAAPRLLDCSDNRWNSALLLWLGD